MKHLSLLRPAVVCLVLACSIGVRADERPSMTGATVASPLSGTFGAASASASTLVSQSKREAATAVAHLLADPLFSASVAEELGSSPKGQDKTASIASVLSRYHAKRDHLPGGSSVPLQAQSVRELQALDRTLLAYKGIERASKGLLDIRLFQPDASAGMPTNVGQLLVASEPAGDDEKWTVVEAHDSQGNLYRLDAQRPPTFPVLVVGIDGKEDLSAGLAAANEVLASLGVQRISPATGRGRVPLRAERIDTARLERIVVKNDEEPWVLGDAEVYAVVSGIQPAQNKPQIQLVDMPYLNDSNAVYSPNQIMIHWSDFRFGAANLILYEHDDNENYKDLAVALATGVQTILGAVQPEFAAIGTVASAVISAMPRSWFTNSDDYLDAFYTLEANRSYIDHAGVSNNATITLTPFQLTSAPES